MSLKSNLKNQLDALSSKVKHAEKAAEKQIKAVLKSTEHLRDHQLKNVRSLVKKAQHLKESDLAKRAEKVAKEIEIRASTGLELMLAKLNIPTRAEIDRLNKKINSLQKRIEESEKATKRS